MKRLLQVVLLSICVWASLMANEEVVVTEIQMSGLSHYDEATVREYLPIKDDQVVTKPMLDEAIKALYQTGFFSDISLSVDGDGILTVQLTERPVVSEIVVQGAHEVKQEQIDALFEQIGLVVDQPYQQSLIQQAKTALQQSYMAMGYKDVDVAVDVEMLDDGRRAVLTIVINEGSVLTIDSISIVGATAFKEKALLRQMQMKVTRPWSFITHSNRFSKPRMMADIEALKSYYYDHGYLNVQLQEDVSTPTGGSGIDITITVDEGEVYHIDNVVLAGDLAEQGDQLRALVTVEPGHIFSRKAIQDNIESIKHHLANVGYAQAEVALEPKLNESKRTVALHLTVQPGKLTHVRNITFSGNSMTKDEVLRRELRQQEAALFSYEQLEESKRRLRNLGYLSQVQSSIKPVPGYPDQVDVDFSVEEESRTEVTFNFGYSEAFGVLYGASWAQPNALGTGTDFSLDLSKGRYRSSASFSFYEPYLTQSGISQQLGFSFVRTTPDKVDLGNYRLDSLRPYVNYGIPITDNQSIGLGVAYEDATLHTNDDSPTYISDFINAHGDRFKIASLSASWAYRHYDQAIFPTKGWEHRLSAQVNQSIQGYDLSYYTVGYNAEGYIPLTSKLVFHARANARYGDGFGKTDAMPPWKHFYAGGIGSVAGYDANSLGPKDSNDKPMGGSVAVDGSVSVISPIAFSDRARVYAFVDGGNVFKNKLDLGDLRYSAGVGMIWHTMLPLQFVLAHPLNKKGGDDTRLFDFTIGTSF